MTNFVETLLLREKRRFDEAQRQLSVVAVPDLLDQTGHVLVHDDDETDAEYGARAALVASLLDHARSG